MYARVARFGGGNAAGLDAELGAVSRDLEAMRRGESVPSMPAELAALTTRMLWMADRDSGASELVMICETESAAREIDRIMKGMSPQSDEMGRRVSADILEVLMDETPG